MVDITGKIEESIENIREGNYANSLRNLWNMYSDLLKSEVLTKESSYQINSSIISASVRLLEGDQEAAIGEISELKKYMRKENIIKK